MKKTGRLYQFLVYGVLTLFAGIIFFVVFNSNNRQSGKTGQDTAEMQMLRYETGRGPAGGGADSGRIPARDAALGRK